MTTPSVAEQNKALMRAIFAAAAAGDRSKYQDRIADDATFTVTGEHSWSQTFRGKASIGKDLFGYVHSLLQKGGKTEPFRFLADEDWVVVEARGDMVTKAGIPYRNHYCLMYRLRDGVIVEMKEYQDSLMCDRILGPFPPEMRAMRP